MSTRLLAALCALGLAACAAPGGAGGNPPAARAGGDGSAAGSLAGTRWLGIVEASAPPASRPRLEFEGGGRLGGHTGCNALGGTWREEGGEVRFAAIATTKRFCVGVAGAIEERLLAALSDRSRATREAGKLVVVGPDGARFEFEKMGSDSNS